SQPSSWSAWRWSSSHRRWSSGSVRGRSRRRVRRPDAVATSGALLAGAKTAGVLLRPSAERVVARITAGLPQARERRDGEDACDHREADPDREVRDRDHLTVVDERQLILVERVEHELDPDEGEQHREPDVEVDETLQETTDEEEQLTQTHEREQVGHE